MILANVEVRNNNYKPNNLNPKGAQLVGDHA